MTQPPRRQLLAGLARGLGRLSSLGALGGLASLGACATPVGRAKPQVVVVGGGYGGASAAKYLRLLSDQAVDVTLVEPSAALVSCPVSNRVLTGLNTLDDITLGYDTLAQRHGVRWCQDRVDAIDASQRQLRLASGQRLRYDKLLLAPGIDFLWDRTEGLHAAHAAGQALHAWKAGPETLALQRQLQALPDGGVVALTVPELPYRCPPGPYERACLVAAWLQRHKPRAKLLVLDANADVTSKPTLFKQAWQQWYPGLLEYRPQYRLQAVDGPRRTLKFEVQEDERADVLNVLPVMAAGRLAQQAGLAQAGGGRWCAVDFLNFQATGVPHVHIIGDAILAAPGMPKSGHMANAQAKVAAAALVAELLGLDPDPQPMLTNTCYSQVSPSQAIHVASVHRYQAAARSFVTVPGSGGVSAAPSELESRLARDWAHTLWADMLG